MNTELAREVELSKVKLSDALSTLGIAYRNADEIDKSDLISLIGTVSDAGMYAFENLCEALHQLNQETQKNENKE
ncbi:hypothetical protein EHW66_21255 [Erwinia psidii]|uniref:hypothetical protein n=1 Tax=Erwinia psidii TaxID=69224 RepID=UPI00226B740A|nr:hypothetical protein [Erwinia psidii]MCX8967398.1 hypothetical protein [Erwinia psidii]